MVIFYSQVDMVLRQFYLLNHNVVKALTMPTAEHAVQKDARVESTAVLWRTCISPVKGKNSVT